MLSAASEDVLSRPLVGVPDLCAEDRVLLENVIAVVYAIVDGTAAPVPRTAVVESAFLDYDGAFAGAASMRRYHVLVFRVNSGAVGDGGARTVFVLNKGMVDNICSVNPLRVVDVSLRLVVEGGVHRAALVVYVLRAAEPVIVSSCDVVRVSRKRRFFGLL